MAETTYVILHSDGKSSITVNEIVGDSTSCSLNLIGKNQPVYGKEQNENFLHLLENFASPTPPEHPTVGQIWFEEVLIDGVYTGSYNLKVCVDTTLDDPWVKIPQVMISTTQPEESMSVIGDMWFDTANHEFKIYDGENGWLKIGPENYSHKDTTYIEEKQSISGFKRIKLDRELFAPNVNEEVEDKSYGSVSLVKLKILSKEVYESLDYQTIDPRCKVWEYTFVVQSINTTEANYDINIVGSPSYNIVAASDNTNDWTVQVNDTIDSETGLKTIFITTQTNPNNNAYVVSYIGVEVEKV